MSTKPFSPYLRTFLQHSAVVFSSKDVQYRMKNVLKYWEKRDFCENRHFRSAVSPSIFNIFRRVYWWFFRVSKMGKIRKKCVTLLRLWSSWVITKPSRIPTRWKVLEKTKNFFFCTLNKILNSLFDKYFKMGKKQLKIGHFSTFEWPYRRLGERKSYLSFAWKKVLSRRRVKESYLGCVWKKVLSRHPVEKSPISASRGKKSYFGFTRKKVLSRRLRFYVEKRCSFEKSVFVLDWITILGH